MSSSPRRSAPAAARSGSRNVRQHARPIRGSILRDPDAVVKCLERAVPDVEYSFSGSKKKKKNTFDFGGMVKEVNNLRDRHGTSKMEDYREDALKRIPKHLLRDPADKEGDTNEGPVLGWFRTQRRTKRRSGSNTSSMDTWSSQTAPSSQSRKSSQKLAKSRSSIHWRSLEIQHPPSLGSRLRQRRMLDLENSCRLE